MGARRKPEGKIPPQKSSSKVAQSRILRPASSSSATSAKVTSPKTHSKQHSRSPVEKKSSANRPQFLSAESQGYRDRLSFLLSSTPAIIYAVEMTGEKRATFVSDNIVAILGYQPSECLNDPMFWIDRLHPEDQPLVLAGFDQLPERGTDTYEYRFRHKDGAYRWMRDDVRLIRDAAGSAIEIVGSWFDITGQKQAEQALLKTQQQLSVHESLYKTLFDRNPHMYFTIERDGTIVSVNQQGAIQLGYSVEELTGRPVTILFPDEQHEAVRAQVTRCFEQAGVTHQWEIAKVLKDGTPMWVQETAVVIQDERSQPLLLILCQNITEHKAAGEALRKAHDELDQRVQDRTAELRQAFQSLNQTTTHLHTLLDQSPLAIIELDLTANVRRWNDAATELFGWTKEEVLGQELPYLSLGQEEESSQIWSRMMRGEPQRNVELRRQRKDGAPVDLSLWSIDLRDPNGARIGYICFFIDITERKKLEAQFRQAQKMEAIGRLAGGVAHDFNNLLTIINGYSAQLVAELSSDPSLREMATETLNAGERAAELTKQLLAFSRRQVLKLQSLNVNESIRSIGSMLTRLLGDDITLTLNLEPDLWAIESDKGQLDQVVLNLAINARDAMPKGGTLTITTSHHLTTQKLPEAHRIMPNGPYVRLSIGDSGYGMSAETLAHIFEPFYTTKPVGQGTGLGLATVYGIVKQSHGYIFVESIVSQGSTFHLYFPRWSGSLPQAAAPTASRSTGTETILLVEDQHSVRTFTVRALKKYGYQIHEASNGEEALRIAAGLHEPIHILLTDVIMPQMTGLVLAERLRQQWPGLRVLFMSGFTDFAQSSCLEMPGTAFIQKPFLPDVLARQLRQLLDDSV
jgi:two-component system, cell cycle sensor histidine kinase and response regulator CckA